MTDGPLVLGMPELVVDHDDTWSEVDLHADPDEWAKAEVRSRLAATAPRATRFTRWKQTVHLQAVVAVTTRPDALAVWLLRPNPDAEVVAWIRMVPIELEPGDDARPVETARLLVAPTELATVEPQEVSDFEAPAGVGARSRARIRRADDGPIQELLTCLWVFPGFSHGVALATGFDDVAEADRWRTTMDQFASGLRRRS